MITYHGLHCQKLIAVSKILRQLWIKLDCRCGYGKETFGWIAALENVNR